MSSSVAAYPGSASGRWMCLPSEDERVARRNVVRNRAHARHCRQSG